MEHTLAPRRIAIAVLIAAVIYGAAVGAGSLLFATGVIATGATHNDCADFRKLLAPQYGGDEEDVPQSAIKAETIKCLDEHQLDEEEAFREEYVIWPAWPAVICALIFLAWPLWSRILSNHERHDEMRGETIGGH